MTKEEKLEEAKRLYKTANTDQKYVLERLFPELKESEGEKIIKFISNELACLRATEITGSDRYEELTNAIAWLEKQGESYTKRDVDDAYLKGVTNTKNEIEKQYEANYQIRKDIATFIFNYRGDIKDRAKWMDYLGIKVYFAENQGEQKPTDKVEPKFKVGDWVVYQNNTFRVQSLSNGTLILQGEKYQTYFIEELCRLWTIEDAKDGDVLSYRDGQWIFIYKEKIDDSSFCYHTLYSTIHQDLTINDAAFTLLSDAITPATKEQRDTLVKAMTEAGYTFDFEKKELKKIELKTTDKKGMNLVEEKMTPFQKKVFCIIDTAIEEEQGLKQVCDELLALAKHEIKQKPAWSEEDKMQLDAAINIVANSGHTCTSDWLKALKERVQLQNGYNPYKEVVESIAEMCKHYDTASHSGLRDFYDNVRVKCKDAKEYDSLYLQNTWKPSDLQIECLSDAIKHYNSQGYTAPVLKELLEQLKKLREE